MYNIKKNRFSIKNAAELILNINMYQIQSMNEKIKVKINKFSVKQIQCTAFRKKHFKNTKENLLNIKLHLKKYMY